MSWRNAQKSSQSPANNAALIVPDDDTDLDDWTRAIYVGEGGSISVVMAEGQNVTFDNAQAGSTIPVSVRRVRATGTDAGALIALW